MAGRKSEKLQRILRVQRQLERMAENDLAHILRERANLDNKRDAIIAATGSLDPVHRSMAGQYARRFSGLESKSQRLETMKSMQEKRLLTEKTKADRLEDSVRSAASDEGRKDEDESLDDLLDAALANKPNSSPA